MTTQAMAHSTGDVSGMAPVWMAAERRRNRRRLRRRVGAAAGLLACTAAAVAYSAGAYYVVFGTHIGHVVQDGVDTGDALAIPLLVMAGVCVVLAVGCMDRFTRLSPSAGAYSPRSYAPSASSAAGVDAPWRRAA